MKRLRGSAITKSQGIMNRSIPKRKRIFKLSMIKKKRIIESHVHFSDNQKKSLLDIGCGEGYALKYFYENGYKVWG